MLVVRDLVKVYPGPVAALQGITLEVPKGMFGLLGPNGAGKSTFMRILAGLLEPTSGSVTLDGMDVLADPRKLWGQLGYLPQEFGFYPHLTGQAMLDYLLRLKGVDADIGRKALVGRLLEQVNLSFAAKRRLKGYSGGMRQRLGIAQAIAGLDPEERLRLYRILAELAEDRTVLLSTHIVEDVAVLCPRFAVIRGGKLLTVTTPGEARARLSQTIYEGQVGPDEMEALVSTRRVTQAILVEGRHRVRIHQTDGPPPAGFTPVGATLEDAYLLMMRDAQASEEATLAAAGAQQ
jgi:ABC-type multidrug transport system ATPase subunit